MSIESIKQQKYNNNYNQYATKHRRSEFTTSLTCDLPIFLPLKYLKIDRDPLQDQSTRRRSHGAMKALRRLIGETPHDVFRVTLTYLYNYPVVTPSSK